MPVNPQLVEWARVSAGVSIEEAAVLLKIKKEQLSCWEIGKKRPSYTQLKKIAKLYKRPSALFFYEHPPKDISLPKDYRCFYDNMEFKELSIKSRFEIRYAHKKRSDAIRLIKMLDKKTKEFIFYADINENIELLVKKWRENFKITLEKQFSFKDKYEALNWWKSSIENYNVLVLQSSIDLEEFRGVSIFEKILPVIIINSKDSVNGRIFSLLHEFCHLLLHVSGISNATSNMFDRMNYNSVEVFCNAFAAECLMPKKSLMDIFSFHQKINISDIKDLSKKYKVSDEVTLRRLLDLNYIDNFQYKEFIKNLKLSYKNKKSKGGPLPHVKSISKNGMFYTGLVLENYDKGNFTLYEASACLDVTANYVKAVSDMYYKKGGH